MKDPPRGLYTVYTVIYRFTDCSIYFFAIRLKPLFTFTHELQPKEEQKTNVGLISILYILHPKS